MNTDDTLDRVQDTIGFLLARMNDDPESAFKIAEAGGDGAIAELLLGMTDLATAMVMTVSLLTGMDAKVIVQQMAMQAKSELPDMMKRRGL